MSQVLVAIEGLQMRFAIPTVAGLQSRVTVRSGEWSYDTTADDTQRSIDVPIPDGIPFGQVEAFMRYLDPRGREVTNRDAIVLKTQDRPRRGRK